MHSVVNKRSFITSPSRAPENKKEAISPCVDTVRLNGLVNPTKTYLALPRAASSFNRRSGFLGVGDSHRRLWSSIHFLGVAPSKHHEIAVNIISTINFNHILAYLGKKVKNPKILQASHILLRRNNICNYRIK